MSTNCADYESVARNLSRGDFVARPEFRGFVRIIEDLEIRMGRAKSILKAKERALSELLSLSGIAGWIKRFRFRKKAERCVEEAQKRVTFISQAIKLHEEVMLEIARNNPCDMQKVSGLLGKFVCHIEDGSNLLENVPDCSLTFIAEKSRRLNNFVCLFISVKQALLESCKA